MTATIVSRLSCALALLLVGACKKHESEAPEAEPAKQLVGYGEQAWTESSPSRSVQPLEVCEHLARLVAAEVGADPSSADPRLLAQCESDLAVEAGIRGTDNWNAIAGCVLEARTGADVDACDRAHPMPAGAAPLPEPSGGEITQREIDVCTHMISVLIADNAASTGEVPALTADEQAMLVDECATALLGEKQARDPADYDRMLDCIAAAKSHAGLQSCETR